MIRPCRITQQAGVYFDLPDFLDILAVSVRAGLGYRYALRRVAESLGGPVGEEMLIVLRQIDLGQDRIPNFAAFRNLVGRRRLSSRPWGGGGRWARRERSG